MPGPSPAARARPWLATAARLLLAAVFAAAGWLKLSDVDESIRAVRAYRLLPEALVGVVGPGLPILEVTLAVLLAVGLVTRMSAALGAVLLVVFIGGVGSAWARGLTIDCGCFGGGGTVAAADTRYLQEILRDAALLVVALLLARWPASRGSLDALLTPRRPGADLPPEPEPGRQESPT